MIISKKILIIIKFVLFNDLKRISKYLSHSIFNDECSIWTGYITTIKNDEKNSYINFYFGKKKHALSRLLYINYVNELDESEYIKFKCNNKGICCNVNHIYKLNETTISPNILHQPVQNDELIKINNNIVNFNL